MSFTQENLISNAQALKDIWHFNSKDNLDLIEMKSVYLPKGFNDFTPFYMFQKGNYFPLYVEVTAK